MGEREIPALVHRAAEAQRRTLELRRVGEKAPQVAAQIADVVRATIPDPREDEAKGAFYLNMTVDIAYRFQDGDEEVGVIFDAPRYPREKDQNQLPSFSIRVGDKAFHVDAVGKGIQRWENGKYVGCDEQELEELKELIKGIHDGLKDETVVAWVNDPRPERRSALDIFAEEQHVAPLG